MPPQFEFRQLRQFVAVAEELSFRRAADRLHMSQPPLSVGIQNLEEAVGAQLLDRSRHHVQLTPAGQLFYRDALRLLQQARMAGERARRAQDGQEGSLRLSFVPSAALDLLPVVFKRFQSDYPTVDLRLKAETTARQLDDLRRGEVDLGLVVGPVYEARDLELTTLRRRDFVVALPRGHLLAPRCSVRMQELAAESFISFPASEGAGFVAALLGACQDAGFLPRVVQEAAQMQSILTLVAGGFGVALVPAAMRHLRMQEVAFVDIAAERGAPSYQLMFAHPRHNDNPVIQAFIAVAVKTLAAADETGVTATVQPPEMSDARLDSSLVSVLR